MITDDITLLYFYEHEYITNDLSYKTKEKKLNGN